MSLTMSLIKYKMNDNGKYFEEDMNVIQRSFLSEPLNEKIVEKIKYAELTLFENEDSQETSVLDCIENTRIDEVIEIIKEEFINLMSRTDNLKSNQKRTNIHEIILEYKEISNIYDLLFKKQSTYIDDNSVIVKIG